MASHPCQSGHVVVSDHGHGFQALVACAASPSYLRTDIPLSTFKSVYPRYLCLKQICLIARHGEEMYGEACGWNLLPEWLQVSTSYLKIGHNSTPAPHMPSEPQKGLVYFVSFVMLGKAFSFLNTWRGVWMANTQVTGQTFVKKKRRLSQISLMPYAALCVMNMFIFETWLWDWRYSIVHDPPMSGKSSGSRRNLAPGDPTIEQMEQLQVLIDWEAASCSLHTLQHARNPGIK